MTIDDRLQAIFEAVFGQHLGYLKDKDSPETIEGWDSLNHVSLMLALEGEFGVCLDADDFANLISVGAIHRRLASATDLA